MIRFASRFVFALLVGAALVVACTQAATPAAPNSAPVTVEVTREQVVVQTVLATVAVPVEVTREIFVEVTPPPPPPGTPPGSPERPLTLVFSPHYGIEVTRLRASALVQALTTATGLALRAEVPATNAEAVALACQDPAATVAFLTALEYTLAARQCDLQAVLAGVRDGIPWSAAMVMVRTTDDPPIATLADLAGRSWGVANPDDVATSLYYRARLAEAGITPGAQTAYDTDTSAVIAGIDGEVDFVTASYLPPILPFDEVQWQYGVDDPELWRSSGSLPYRSGIGFVVVIDYVENGGYRVRDARASALDARNRIFIDTRILDLSPQIPNDAVALGAQMPLAVANALTRALQAHGTTPACGSTLCSSDFFNWEALSAVEPAAYDAVQFTIDRLDLSAEEVLDLLD